MAGGGIKGGITYGKTDDFSYNIVENPVHVRDFNATILHQLGIDHRQTAQEPSRREEMAPRPQRPPVATKREPVRFGSQGTGREAFP